MLKLNQSLERLNQYVKVLLYHVRNKILITALLFIVFLDMCSTWISDFIYPLNNKEYATLYFSLKSLEAWIISIFCLFVYDAFLKNLLGTKASRWVYFITNTWVILCGADFFDVVTGVGSEINFLDKLSVVAIAFSLLKNVFFKQSNQFREPVSLNTGKLN